MGREATGEEFWLRELLGVRALSSFPPFVSVSLTLVLGVRAPSLMTRRLVELPRYASGDKRREAAELAGRVECRSESATLLDLPWPF